MTHLAYDRRLAFAFGVAISGALACTAGVRASGTTGSGGSGAVTGAGGTGTGGSNSPGTGGGVVIGTGGTPDVNLGTGGNPNPDAAACQQQDIPFSPTIPTVFILVDRSGSEFDASSNGTTGTFFTLRTAVEKVISQLDAKVRFGFGAFVGNGANPKCSVDFADTVVPFNLNNSANIAKEYDSLGPLLPVGSKANTPMSDVIPLVKQMLVADQATVSGAKYLMVVTDSETDFCDDGSAICPADAVTWQIQDLYASGFPTLVVGLPVDSSSGTGDALAPEVLQAFANAGAGQPVAVLSQNPGQVGKASDIFYACNNVAPDNPGTNSWQATYALAGHTAADLTTIATYSATGGTAPVYSPSAADTTSLVTQISAALNSIPRSCTFDLSKLQIYTDDLSGAVVYMTDSSGKQTPVPLDTQDTNGWDMINPTAVQVGGMTKHTATELQLFGSYCTQLQSQSTVGIKFNFPCEVIITIN